MKKLIAVGTALLLFNYVAGQAFIVRNGQASGRIIADQSIKTDKLAADLLNHFIRRITGATLPLAEVAEGKKPGDIFIRSLVDTLPEVKLFGLKEDGFNLSCDGNFLTITGGPGSGAIYGVVTFLEDWMGVRCYAADAWVCPENRDIQLPEFINRTENPGFRYRQTQAYSMRKDTLYKIWHRLEEPGEIFAANYWVHTFDRILPSAKFGKTHPEYYSLINGERRPGSASQWCLTNPEVFEIVSARVDSIFKANPGRNIISVSQNDGNFTNCTCDVCKAIDEMEGSPSGTIIHFLNKLAARFPDKEFSTLAYLYSVSPPAHVKPLPNVNIMLCDIDCYREVSLTENASGREFVKNLEGWADISDNIFVWDYGINFDNYVSPFPNLHILQANMQLFKKNNVNMHFSQIAGSKGGDFSELRSYLVAKLLWNPYVDVDSVMKCFLDGYYGKASPYIYQYIKLQEGALLGSGIPLWIYDTPITHKEGMLNANLMKRYRKLFDEAEKAVASDQVILNRVWQQRLSIQYAELEIARTKAMDDPDRIRQELALFRERAKHLGVTILNERNNTIEEYCDLYLKRNLPGRKVSLAHNASVTYTLPPSKPYDLIADKALTDGLLGGATFNESWVGWEKNDAEVIIDLGEAKEFNTVEVDMLHKLGSWILLPKSITVKISSDNIGFALMGRVEIPEDRSPEVKYVSKEIISKNKIKARYIKVHIENTGICPSWHYGVGYPAWFFMDEIRVY